MDTEREIPWWKQLLAQFQSFLIMILMVATAISAFEWLLEDPRETALPYEAIVILAIVVLNALLGFIQEARCAFGSGVKGTLGSRNDRYPGWRA